MSLPCFSTQSELFSTAGVSARLFEETDRYRLFGQLVYPHLARARAALEPCYCADNGRTALEPKAALGAKPEAMSVWVRHRVPAFNWLLRGVLGAVPHAEAPERNPFKITAADDTKPE